MKQYYIQLSKDFPLAYKEMEDTDTTFKTRISLEYDSKTSDGIMVPESLRDLYDWFDPLDIIVTPEYNRKCKRWEVTVTSPTVSVEYISMFMDRIRTEKSAIYAAFEIREEQLKLKQK